MPPPLNFASAHFVAICFGMIDVTDILRRSAVFAAVVLLGIAQSGATEIVPASKPGPAGEPFSGYDDLCGFPVVTDRTAHISLATVDPSGAPLIVLDPRLDAPGEEYRRTFLIAHECAHHRLGHVTKDSFALRSVSRRAVRDQEMSADCWAAEQLARVGEDRTVRIMMDRFFKSGFYSPGGGYPSGLQRSTIIRECAEIGRKAAGSP